MQRCSPTRVQNNYTAPLSKKIHTFTLFLTVLNNIFLFQYIAEIGALNDVMEAVCNVVIWFNLGLALGLKQPTLKAIEYQNKPEDCKREMLTKWLHRFDTCRPSWKALVEALRSPNVKSYDAADGIEEKFKAKM